MIYNTFWLEKVVKKLCVTYTFGCCRRTQNSFYSVWKNSHKNFSLSSISLTTTCSNYFYLYNERTMFVVYCVPATLFPVYGTVLLTRVSISVTMAAAMAIQLQIQSYENKVHNHTKCTQSIQVFLSPKFLLYFNPIRKKGTCRKFVFCLCPGPVLS